MKLNDSFIILWSVVMVIMFLYSLRNDRNLKSEIISFGILGTFIGIFVGLYKFDVNHIENSVPLLLEGMKFSFVTSIEGMGLSILLSILKKQKERKSNVESLLNNLIEINQRQEELLKNFATSNSEEFVKALQEVIKNLNIDVVKEMGFNFEKLNNSINILIKWQEENKNIIGNSVVLLKQGNEFIKEFEKSKLVLENINQETKKSVEILKESLSLLLKEANGRI